MPELTPRIPRMLPWRAVACDARPDMEPFDEVRREKGIEMKRLTNAKHTADEVTRLNKPCHTSSCSC